MFIERVNKTQINYYKPSLNSEILLSSIKKSFSFPLGGVHYLEFFLSCFRIFLSSGPMVSFLHLAEFFSTISLDSYVVVVVFIQNY